MTRKKETDSSKATRTRSLTRTADRKKKRRDVQDAAARRNKALKARGELTPWQQSKARSAERRAERKTQGRGQAA